MRKFRISYNSQDRHIPVFKQGLQDDPCHLPLDKVTAIKAVRHLTAMGLKDAKDTVESLYPGTPLQLEANDPKWEAGEGPEAVRALRALGLDVERIGGDTCDLLNSAAASALAEGQPRLARDILTLLLEADLNL